MIPVCARNIEFVGHTDQNGRGDGVQVMVTKGHAFVGHMFSDGFTVTDVRDPRNPKPVNFIPAPANSRAFHLQTHEDLLLTVNSPNIWVLQGYSDPNDYFRASITETFTKREKTFTAGLRVFDISKPAEPREIGFMPVDGLGLHRLWYVGGRYAYASCHWQGFTDHVLAIIDMADPTRPEVVGRWWLPGMHTAGGETPSWSGKRYALHHAIVAGNLAYAAWRDGGMTILDVADPTAPKLLAHRNWCPPFGGGTHTPLPLPDRNLAVFADEGNLDNCANGIQRCWVFDVREPTNPVQIAHNPVEEFHILFLNRKNALILDERQQRGTIDHTPVYPREVVKRALELNASALILVHNHPSGDPTPSKADIAVTRDIVNAGKPLGVTVHDHIIIGRGRHTSLRDLGLL